MPNTITGYSEPPTPISEFQRMLPRDLSHRLRHEAALAPFTTLNVGGNAKHYLAVNSRDEFATAVSAAYECRLPYFVLGGGSNICVSDKGIATLVIHNLATNAWIGANCTVDTGCSISRLFQQTLEQSLSGLEFAVGIPGTVGGALVSNAGAYRNNISEIVASVDVVEEGARKTVTPEWMQFRYRDSRLRKKQEFDDVALGVTLNLKPSDRHTILASARENQRQRLYKQPWLPSAGSFFKNVENAELANQLPELPENLRRAGVVPAGYLNSACGCRGMQIGGAGISQRHGNFVINLGGATASEIRTLTSTVQQRVFERFGVNLEPEVLLVGDWSSVN